MRQKVSSSTKKKKKTRKEREEIILIASGVYSVVVVLLLLREEEKKEWIGWMGTGQRASKGWVALQHCNLGWPIVTSCALFYCRSTKGEYQSASFARKRAMRQMQGGASVL